MGVLQARRTFLLPGTPGPALLGHELGLKAPEQRERAHAGPGHPQPAPPLPPPGSLKLGSHQLQGVPARLHSAQLLSWHSSRSATESLLELEARKAEVLAELVKPGGRWPTLGQAGQGRRASQTGPDRPSSGPVSGGRIHILPALPPGGVGWALPQAEQSFSPQEALQAGSRLPGELSPRDSGQKRAEQAWLGVLQLRPTWSDFLFSHQGILRLSLV